MKDKWVGIVAIVITIIGWTAILASGQGSTVSRVGTLESDVKELQEWRLEELQNTSKILTMLDMMKEDRK